MNYIYKTYCKVLSKDTWQKRDIWICPSFNEQTLSDCSTLDTKTLVEVIVMEKVDIIELPKSKDQEALEFLMKAGLTDAINDDITILGYAGESRNKLIIYLIITSRKMDKPLAGIVRGGSSAGKSYLVEVVISLAPDEEKDVLTRATKQAFFYEDNLSHKVIYIREATGCEEASYAVRTLLSEKELKLKRTVGLGVQEFTVRGPVAYIETTAEETVETQMANRVFEIWIDESEEHTQEIHRLQREKYTLTGLERSQQFQDIIDKHHTIQRLLKPLSVVIPFVTEIDFPSRLVRNRRDHQRFLDLIGASAFLHQFQRPHGQLDDQEYVEATLDDYGIAYWLMEPVIIRALDDYATKPRELLDGICNMVMEKTGGEPYSIWKVIFTRAELANYLGWTRRQVRTHIKELEELEAIEVVRGGRGREYNYKLLRDPGQEAWHSKLLKPEELKEKLQEP